MRYAAYLWGGVAGSRARASAGAACSATDARLDNQTVAGKSGSLTVGVWPEKFSTANLPWKSSSCVFRPHRRQESAGIAAGGIVSLARSVITVSISPEGNANVTTRRCRAGPTGTGVSCRWSSWTRWGGIRPVTPESPRGPASSPRENRSRPPAGERGCRAAATRRGSPPQDSRSHPAPSGAGHHARAADRGAVAKSRSDAA